MAKIYGNGNGAKKRKKNVRMTPQSQPIPGRKGMKMNDAGGYTFKLSRIDMVRRFCILGSENNGYYVSAKKATRRNAKNIEKLVADGKGNNVVDVAHEINVYGRAPKVSPQLFAVAYVFAKARNPGARRYARDAAKDMIRTASHLFEFNVYLDSLGKGWGRLRRELVADYYYANTDIELSDLAYQIVKYRQRDGYTHRKLIRRAHVKPRWKAHSSLLSYATGSDSGYDASLLPAQLQAYLKINESMSIDAFIDLLQSTRLPWETAPTWMHNSGKFWYALAQSGSIPPHAILRNMTRFSKLGLLKDVSFYKLIADKIFGDGIARKKRIHPFHYFMPYMALRGSVGDFIERWQSRVMKDLESGFYAAFEASPAISGNTKVCIDASGSMFWDSKRVMGAQYMYSGDAAAAIALMIAKKSDSFRAVAFDVNEKPFRKITHNSALDTIINEIRSMGHGGTNAGAPILSAINNGEQVDQFIILTDNDVWAGDGHVTELLNRYRDVSGINARLAVLAFAPTRGTIADPEDRRQIDFGGLDSAVPRLLTDFLNREF